MARILSRQDLEVIGDELTRDFYRLRGIPSGVYLPLDPERFITEYVRVRLLYLPPLDDSILGLTVNECCTYIVHDRRDRRYELQPGDIVINSGLNRRECIGRRNFTLMHEAAHVLLGRRYPGEYAFRETHVYRLERAQRDWEEWQADNLASVLLMPSPLVLQLLHSYSGFPKTLMRPDWEEEIGTDLVIRQIADTLGVSVTALIVRLRQLKLIYDPKKRSR